MKILIIGNGFVGARCHAAWSDSVLSSDTISTTDDVRAILDREQPDAVLNAAGVRGRPNVDWCETHQVETMNGNVMLPLMIAEACQERGVYLLHIGSGCIFYGDSPHADKAWREDDFGNPVPVYSRSKWAADLVLSTLPNTGIGRIRMPLDHIHGPNNLIDKLAGFEKVIDVENSVTVIDDMVAAFHRMLEKRSQGIFHVTNPGTVKHRDIIGLYEELVDSSHACTWISNEELMRQGLAVKGRSNNFLASDRLVAEGIHMRPAKEALRDTMQKYAKAKV